MAADVSRAQDHLVRQLHSQPKLKLYVVGVRWE